MYEFYVFIYFIFHFLLYLIYVALLHVCVHIRKCLQQKLMRSGRKEGSLGLLDVNIKGVGFKFSSGFTLLNSLLRSKHLSP